MSETIRNAAEEVRKQLDAKAGVLKASPLLAEVLQLHQALNALQAVLGEEKTPIFVILGFDVATESRDGSTAPVVRFDEFFGKPPLQAAKLYLKRCSDARPFAEIVDAIRRGGGKVDSEEDLRTGLTRSTLDMVKIGDRFGAIEKYDHIKRGGRRKKGVSEAIDADIETEEMQAQIKQDVSLLADGDDTELP